MKKNRCPRENECLFAGELKTKMKQNNLKQKMRKGGKKLKYDDSGEIRSEGSYKEGVGIRN